MHHKKELEELIKKELPDIIKQIRNGDGLAKDRFAILVIPYISFLIRRYKKSINDDLGSTANWIAFKLISAIDKFNLDKPVVGYITTATNNYCLDMIKANNRLKRSAKLQPLNENIIMTKKLNPIDKLFSDEDNEIYLSYVDGYSIYEIAASTGTPVVEVERIIQTANEYFG